MVGFYLEKRKLMNQSSSYENFLQIQLRNSRVLTIRIYFSYLYSLISSRLEKRKNILEIGSGAGISSEFLTDLNITHTDLLAWEDNDVIGGIDAMSLPYPEDTFDGVFAVDALHHIPYPAKALLEMIRVCTPNSEIVLIEPYVSVLSFPVYRIFHTETTSWRTLKFKFDAPMIGNEPNEGDQCITQSIFLNDLNCQRLKDLSSKEIAFEYQYISPLAFFATGGLTRPIKWLSFIIAPLITIEKRMPQFLLKHLGSRICVVINVGTPKLPQND
jgi:SAM-dependent methyltransferase